MCVFPAVDVFCLCICSGRILFYLCLLLLLLLVLFLTGTNTSSQLLLLSPSLTASSSSYSSSEGFCRMTFLIVASHLFLLLLLLNVSSLQLLPHLALPLHSPQEAAPPCPRRGLRPHLLDTNAPCLTLPARSLTVRTVKGA